MDSEKQLQVDHIVPKNHGGEDSINNYQALYDKFVSFTEDMEGVGKAIDKASETHSKAMNKLSTGKGNLITKANQMRELGVKTTKNMPPSLMGDHGENS